MFKNKHVIAALIMAPVLAVIGYLAVDRLVSEKPHAARQNTSYPLAAKSGCRYASGECRLQNGDVKITLKPAVFSQDSPGIQLISSLPIDGAKIALSSSNIDGVPIAFESADQEKLEWVTSLPGSDDENAQLQLVVFSGETMFFAELDAVFLQTGEPAKQR